MIMNRDLNDFDILCKDNTFKFSNKGFFSNKNHLIINTKEILNIENGNIIEKKFNNHPSEFYIVTDSSFETNPFESYYKVHFEKRNKVQPTSKIEIVNSSELAFNLSEAFGINKETVTILINNQTEIKKLFEEQNFLTADSLTVAKETLCSVRNNENKLDINKILSVIDTLISIFKSTK